VEASFAIFLSHAVASGGRGNVSYKMVIQADAEYVQLGYITTLASRDGQFVVQFTPQAKSDLQIGKSWSNVLGAHSKCTSYENHVSVSSVAPFLSVIQVR
jgi:hypothetical protein